MSIMLNRDFYRLPSKIVFYSFKNFYVLFEEHTLFFHRYQEECFLDFDTFSLRHFPTIFEALFFTKSLAIRNYLFMAENHFNKAEYNFHDVHLRTNHEVVNQCQFHQGLKKTNSSRIIFRNVPRIRQYIF